MPDKVKPDHRTINCDTADHYAWGEGCEGWRYLDAPDLSVIVERVPGGASEVRHLHRHVRQLFFMLEGRASIEIAGTVVTLGPGQAVHVPPETPHRFHNCGSQDVRVMVISSAPARNDRVELHVAPGE